MFNTEQLNAIPGLLTGYKWSQTAQEKLSEQYQDLEVALLEARASRQASGSGMIYVVQSHIHTETGELAYLFVPFILSNLNRTIIYTTPATDTVLNILNKYYQAEKKLKLTVENVLDALKMYIDLTDATEDGKDFFYVKLIGALCRAEVTTVFLITEYRLDQQRLKVLSDFLRLDIFVICVVEQQAIMSSQMINMGKLLFKNKDEEHSQLCTLFSQKNAELLMYTDSLSLVQTTNLIEDMFYSEHIYEKMSVYAEYIQTRIQNSQKNQRHLWG